MMAAQGWCSVQTCGEELRMLLVAQHKDSRSDICHLAVI